MVSGGTFRCRFERGTCENLAGFLPVVVRWTRKAGPKKKLVQNMARVALNKLGESGIFMTSARGVAQPG